MDSTKTIIPGLTQRPSAGDAKAPGYDEWLKAEIAAGAAELDAGKGIPAAEAWKELGLE